MKRLSLSLALVLVGPAGAAQDSVLVRRAQQVIVSSLDSSLPAVPFAKWLAQLGRVSPDAIRWEVNDCGEGGDGRTAPTCVEAAFDLAPSSTANVSLTVAGRDGASVKPAIAMLYARAGSAVRMFKTLPEWVAYVRRGEP